VTDWPQVRLEDCCEIVSGATPSTSVDAYWDGDVCWATPKDLSDLEGAYISDTPRKITSEGLRSCAASVLPVESVLFSSRAPIGHVAINTVPMATNQGFKSLVPKADRVHAKFLYHWLRLKRVWLEGLGNGATFKEVSKAIVSRIEIPLPPLAEQRRIAAILDQADALRTKRRQALTELNTLTQSIFLEMFGDPATNPNNWPVALIGELLESATYGTSEKSRETGDIAVMRMNNITAAGDWDFSDLKFMSLPKGDFDRFTVRAGDILFNRTNSAELVGKTAVFREINPMAYAGYLVRLRANEENNAEYIGAFLNTAYAKKVLRGMCKSIIGMANINATEVQRIRIPRPPQALQDEFARLVAALADRKVCQESASAELNNLFASLQQRAFRGDL